ncbi:helix-turn-helix domain-containing protein [Streptomyces olivoreticuli]
MRALLRDRRMHIDPAAHGLLPGATGQGRLPQGLSQAQVDQLLHRAFGTYGRLESGRYPSPPDDLLEGVARLFRFTEEEWKILWRYAVTTDPPYPLHPHSGKEIAAVWQEAIDGIGHMAYVNNQSWDVLAHNESWVRMFPRREAPPNTMRWMLLAPEARHILIDWETSWVPLVIPQLRSALAALPNDEVLLKIKRDVLADPVVGPLFEATPDQFLHPDGDERPLHHPELGRGWVSVAASEPLSSPRARLIILLFRTEQTRPRLRPPLTRPSPLSPASDQVHT